MYLNVSKNLNEVCLLYEYMKNIQNIYNLKYIYINFQMTNVICMKLFVNKVEFTQV